VGVEFIHKYTNWSKDPPMLWKIEVSGGQRWEGMRLEDVARGCPSSMSMGQRVLYSDADHINSRLILDIFARRVLRIRGCKWDIVVFYSCCQIRFGAEA